MIQYKNILFGTDFSEDAEVAFLHALDMARKYKSSLHIIHVLHSGYKYSRHIINEMTDSPDGEAFVSKEIIEKADELLRSKYGQKAGDVADVRITTIAGVPFVEIVKYAKDNNIDLIVLGAKGKSEFDDINFGSTVANVAQRAHCHVTAIRSPRTAFVLPGAI